MKIFNWQLLVAVYMLSVVCVNRSVAEDDWTFIIAPYALVPTISGDSSVGTVEDSEIDVGPKDILNNLDIGGMIQLEAHHKSGYGLSLAYNYMDLGAESSTPIGLKNFDADIKPHGDRLIFMAVFDGGAWTSI